MFLLKAPWPPALFYPQTLAALLKQAGFQVRWCWRWNTSKVMTMAARRVEPSVK
jgi:hypothetical protein